jgi:ferrous iron transport protein B
MQPSTATRRADLRMVEGGAARDEPLSPPTPRRWRIALVGNPNVGKSVIFGALTGAYATVSNYPGTTVEVTRAAARSDATVEVVDTPGVNSLTPQSEDEQVTRDILLSGVDLVVQVADAKNLARALILSSELADAGIPFVMALNMMDEAADRGLRIDAGRLSAELGVPVIPTVAISGLGLRDLANAVPRAAVSRCRMHYSVVVDRALLRIERLLAGHSVSQRWLALMCLAGAETMRSWMLEHVVATARATIEATRHDLQTEMGAHIGYELHRQRVRAAEQFARRVTTVLHDEPVTNAPTTPETIIGVMALAACLALFSADMGVIPSTAIVWIRAAGWFVLVLAAMVAQGSATMRVALGRWASRRRSGPLVLFVVLYVLYQFVGVFAAGTAVNFLEKTVFGQYITPIIVGGIDTLVQAVAPSGAAAAVFQLARDLVVGPYGLVTVALTYALAIILPIVTAFFLAFSVLEDSGYLPRLAVIVNRVFRAMGLNGKAVLPMVLGLGCDTMATLTARIMETRKERLLVTLLLALGVPCSAQLGVILGFFGSLPLWAPLVWGGVVLGVLFAVGWLAARLLPGERSDLILELPPMRRPQLSNIVIKTVGRLQWYLREAVPIFVLGTLVLFFADATGALSRIVRAAEPAVVGMLNLPPKAAEAFLVGFFRRDYGSAGIYDLFQHGLLTPVQAVVALITITLFVPCVANFFIIIKERGVRTALAMSAFIFPFAFVVGGAVNIALRSMGLQ